MRSLALALIVANLAYLGWATMIDPTKRPVPGAGEDLGAQSIVLAKEREIALAASAALSERTRAQKAAAQSPPSVEAVDGSEATKDRHSSAGSHCVSVGPFRDLTSAAQASATLKTAGHDSRQRVEQGQVWVGYWVSIPDIAKREDAETTVAKLKQNGITDVYVSLSSADQGASNVISLGVFKEADRAHKMLADAKALGFPAQITDRTRSGSVYWIDVDTAKQDAPIDYSMLGAEPGKILRLEQRACDSSSN